MCGPGTDGGRFPDYDGVDYPFMCAHCYLGMTEDDVFDTDESGSYVERFCSKDCRELWRDAHPVTDGVGERVLEVRS